VHEHPLEIAGLWTDDRHAARLQRLLPRVGDLVALPVGMTGDEDHGTAKRRLPGRNPSDILTAPA